MRWGHCAVAFGFSLGEKWSRVSVIIKYMLDVHKQPMSAIHTNSTQFRMPEHEITTACIFSQVEGSTATGQL